MSVEKLKIVSDEPNKALIKQLERLLKRAKEGELLGMASVCAWKEDYVTHGWCDPPLSFGNARMLGELTMLVHRKARRMADDEEDYEWTL